MSEPENFLTRWSRLKRESDAAPAAKPVETSVGAATPAEPAVLQADEPAFDLALLPSLDSIGADSDLSMFMQPGVPALLKRAALRRAWTSDPAIRDFRGPQETDWDFAAPDDIPGFGTFKSEGEIRELAQRLFGGGSPTPEPVPQSAPQDSNDASVADACSTSSKILDKDQETQPHGNQVASGNEGTTAVQQDDDTAVQRGTARRHGGALPQ
jgi:hypothetical protein